MLVDAPLTLGVEEEYQIIDPDTRGLSAFVQQMIDDSKLVLGEQVKPEFMQSQIEVGSRICQDVSEVRSEIIRLRRAVHEIAQKNGRSIVAASTHPFSRWDEQPITTGERYAALAQSTQMVGRRMLIFGMHVHVGFGTTPAARELMIDIQNQLRYFLPHILALTTSSPFWLGRDTGLKSYRSIIFENMPRTGIPPVFSSYQDFLTFLSVFDQAGALGKRSDGKADYTKLWWDARPQEDFGTLEVRVSDICTRVDEAVAIAAMIQALMAKLIKLRRNNQSWRIYRTEFISENKWRAVRYGLDGNLIDFGKLKALPMRDLAEEMLEFVDDVVDELGSRQEIEYIRTITAEGTSADRQLATFQRALADGATNDEAIKAVMDHLIQETIAGVVEPITG
jgi:glutamate---cysteine ligase / carboxylate-amine ligase